MSMGRGLRMPHVKAIRRFSVRTVLPEPIAALGDLASNLRWSWHPPTRDLFQRIDPARWEKVRKDPVRLLSALSPQELSDLAGDSEFVASRLRGQGRPGHVPVRAALVPGVGRRGRGRRAQRDRLLQPRVRHHRGAAAVLRRPRHPRRRPPEDRLRPRRPDRRGRPLLQDRLLQAEPQPRRLAAGDLPGPRPRRAPAQPAARGRRHAVRHHPGPARWPRAARPRLEGAGRPGAAAAARLGRRRTTTTPPATSPTGSTAAAASSGSSRRCCSGSAGSAPCGSGRGSPAPRRRTSTTPTRATPASSASSGSTS